MFIFAVLVFKNDKKCKKMKKNEKKSQKNLHISKICCNFAPSFEKDTKTTPIINTKKLPNYDNESKQAKRNCKNY